MSGGGDHHTVPFMQAVRAALILSRREKINLLVAALFSGPTNYIALSTAAFFGIGMYIVGGGLPYLPFPALVVVAAVAGALFAAVVGLATLRIAGVYFVIFTLGLAELVRQIVAWAQHVMGTSSGLYVLIGISDQAMYWLLLGLAALAYLVGWFIGRSRLGFALRIIGNDEVVAVHSGINTARAKVVLFVISSTFAAVTGALVAPRWSYVEPSIAFSPFLSFEVVIMALLGGVHRLWGPLLGVIPFTLLGLAAGRRDPVHAAVGVHLGQVSRPDDAAARRLLSVDRLFHPPRGGRADRGSGAAAPAPEGRPCLTPAPRQ